MRYPDIPFSGKICRGKAAAPLVFFFLAVHCVQCVPSKQQADPKSSTAAVEAQAVHKPTLHYIRRSPSELNLSWVSAYSSIHHSGKGTCSPSAPAERRLHAHAEVSVPPPIDFSASVSSKANPTLSDSGKYIWQRVGVGSRRGIPLCRSNLMRARGSR